MVLEVHEKVILVVFVILPAPIFPTLSQDDLLYVPVEVWKDMYPETWMTMNISLFQKECQSEKDKRKHLEYRE